MKFYHKIRFKITLGISLIVLFLFAGLGYSILIDQRHQILDSLNKNGSQLMTVIAKNSIDAIRLYNYLYLEELCITVEQSHGIAFCEIYDTQNNSLVQKSVVDATTLKKERKTGVNILILEHPIVDKKSNHLGKVELGVYLDDLQQKLKNTTIKIIVILICVILFVALSLNLFISKFFITPVLNLSHGASLLAQKKFINVDNKPRKDEIGELIKNFDIMSDNLKQSFEKIEKQNIELSQSENKFSEVFKLSPNAYSITRVSDGTFIEINNSFTKVFGYTKEDIKDNAVLTTGYFVSKYERKRVAAKLLIEGRLENEETQYKTKDGRILDILISSVIIEIGKEKVILAEAVDITQQKRIKGELKESEMRFQQAQKMESIGTLAGGIAHDFNNILFPILGHTELLLCDLPTNSSFYESLNEIYASSMRAKELVQQILTFSRYEKHEVKIVKIQPILKETLKMIRATIPASIEIIQDINENCGPVKADPTHIHQLLMNLLTNAFHAVEDNVGQIKVNLYRIELKTSDLINQNMIPGSYNCIAISDTGMGMDEKTRTKIFEPFFTTKELGKGTGMGLSVIHGIIETIGGGIDVLSEIGKGTTFIVYIPGIRSTAKEQSLQIDEPVPEGTERILLVDDEESILNMVSKMLQRLGYTVNSCTDSNEAFKLFYSDPEQFDIVITDMAMPVMPGDILAAELLAINPDIPILLCTGYSNEKQKANIDTIGVKGILDKPVVMKDMAKKIREILDKQ